MQIRRLSRKFALCVVSLLLIVPLLLYLEESQVGIFSNAYGNYYNAVVFRQISAIRPIGLTIAIVVVIDVRERLAEYEIAHRTLSCYAQIHNYELVLIDFSTNATLRAICPQDDFMFRRHCAVADLLKRRADLDFVLFVDGDMAVINPDHLIEEYLVQSAELIFYERIFNYEIMAGSYIAKRTKFTIEFLERWANYFNKLPDSFHGTDNGAIHKSVFKKLKSSENCRIHAQVDSQMIQALLTNKKKSVFLDVACDENCAPDARRRCARLWRASQNYADLQLFASCARAVLGDRNELADGRLYLVTNHSSRYGRYWARDGWLTRNEWSPDDFLLHGWQRKRYNRVSFAGWNSPLVINNNEAEFASSKVCATRKNAAKIWSYKDTFIKPNAYITRKIAELARQTHANHIDNLRRINDKSL